MSKHNKYINSIYLSKQAVYYDILYLICTAAQIPGVPPHTSQISHLLLDLSLWLLVPGLSSQFLPYLPVQPTLKVTTCALVSNILGKWLHDFISFGNPWIRTYVGHRQCMPRCAYSYMFRYSKICCSYTYVGGLIYTYMYMHVHTCICTCMYIVPVQ